MQPQDFVFNQIYTGALKDGAAEKYAHEQAVLGLEDFKKGKFNKPIELIKFRISAAKKESK